MKVTYNWLKDFVEIKIPASALADKLTMAGLEVVSLEKHDGDYVFEIEITSNRPDWLSVVGVAREVAAITKSKVKSQKSKVQFKIKKFSKKQQLFKIKVEDRKDCPLYTARIIQGVKVGTSPDWLKKRLELVGCRSINNIVDTTNYILFETGEPMHAFDLDKLRGSEIIVRRARKEEKIITIDGEARLLSPEMLVIADEERAVAVAGVMGAKDTEVSDTTRNVLLEAAVFYPLLVRHARQRLGLQSESAYRFERGVDAQAVAGASLRAAGLIQELSGGEVSLVKQKALIKPAKKNVSLSVSRANKILGTDINAAKIKRALTNLGFQPKFKSGDVFDVGVPSYRADVNLEIDLIEEISRIFGYENIPSSLPAMKLESKAREARDVVVLIKNILSGLGLNEVITNSLLDAGLLKSCGVATEGLVEILNPLSKEQEILRPTLLPSLLKRIAYNLNQKQGYVGIFEVAKVFTLENASPGEKLSLGLALSGARALLLGQGLVKDPVGLLHLKGILEALLERLGIKGYDFRLEDNGRTAAIYIQNNKIGFMGRVSNDVLGRIDIKNNEVFVAEVSLKEMLAAFRADKKLIPPAVYPGISRDISVVLRDDLGVGEILSAVRNEAGPLLESVKITDYYKGQQIPPGFKGLTISCLYRSPERTLTEAEIIPTHSAVAGLLTGKFGAKIR